MSLEKMEHSLPHPDTAPLIGSPLPEIGAGACGTGITSGAQMQINFEAAREAGEQAATACLAKAERSDPEFSAKATAAILAHLRAVGQASGEVLVDVAIAYGARCPDARAFGTVFAGLLRKNLVCVTGYAPRRKGHGCMGAKIYAIRN